MARPDLDVDPAPVEGRECVLQADAELPDHPRGRGQLLFVLVEREVFDPQAPPEIPNGPLPRLILRDLDVGGPRERLLVERVRDDLTDGVARLPRLENLFDVQVEQPNGHGSSLPERRGGAEHRQLRHIGHRAAPAGTEPTGPNPSFQTKTKPGGS
jgi:hypothetical protein